MTARLAIHTSGITMHFGDKAVVRGVDLHVPAGEIYGFLGPNGAGKTTVIMMLLGLLRPSAGMVAIGGKSMNADASAIRHRIGALQEKPYIYPEMTAREYLHFFARIYGVPDAHRCVGKLLEMVNLVDAADRRLATYSRGMQQKACLARALVHDPDILILDEPAGGLDPHGLKDLREVLLQLRAAGRTIFLSSHHLSENEKICDRIGILSEGELVHEGSLNETMHRLESRPVYDVETAPGTLADLDALTALPFVLGASRKGELVQVELMADVPNAREQIATAVQSRGGAVLMVKKQQTSLESIFLAMTSKRIA